MRSRYFCGLVQQCSKQLGHSGSRSSSGRPAWWNRASTCPESPFRDSDLVHRPPLSTHNSRNREAYRIWPGSSFGYGCFHRRSAAPLTRNFQAAKTDSYDVASASARNLSPMCAPGTNAVSHWSVKEHVPPSEQPCSIHYQRVPSSSHVPFVILRLPDANRTLHFALRSKLMR